MHVYNKPNGACRHLANVHGKEQINGQKCRNQKTLRREEYPDD